MGERKSCWKPSHSLLDAPVTPAFLSQGPELFQAPTGHNTEHLPPQADVLGLGLRVQEWAPTGVLGTDWGQGFPSILAGYPPTFLEGTAQAGLAVPLVVTDGAIAASVGCLHTVTPNAQLVSTALTVPGAELQGTRPA